MDQGDRMRAARPLVQDGAPAEVREAGIGFCPTPPHPTPPRGPQEGGSLLMPGPQPQEARCRRLTSTNKICVRTKICVGLIRTFF